jgi:hypothetical protein
MVVPPLLPEIIHELIRVNPLKPWKSVWSAHDAGRETQKSPELVAPGFFEGNGASGKNPD